MPLTLPATAATPAERIRHPLDRLRDAVRRYALFDAAVLTGLLLAAWFGLGFVLDWGAFRVAGWDWVQESPRALRAAVLLAVVGLGGGFVAWRVARRLNRELSYPSLALVLEKRFPRELGDRLITAVELADVEAQAKYGYSAALIRQTIDEARDAVEPLPVETVLNWPRLRRRAWTLLGMATGGAALAVAVFALTDPRPTAGKLFARSMELAAIWGERNVLLWDTPWPRRAHLELVGFPGDELRVGRDAPPPKVRARAFRWVVADRATRDGWRPMLERDLVDHGAPDPSIHSGSDALIDDLERDGRLSAELMSHMNTLAEATVIRRSVRRLDRPEAVTLKYTGPKTGGTLGLSREPGGDFLGEVADLKESVRFRVTGGDFTTAPRRITLVPPPQFVSLKQTEYQPAYLYHPAPADAAAAALKGLRQVFRDRALSLTGDRTVASVPAGTDLELTGTADRPLAKVLVTPRAGRVPGMKAAGEPVEIPANGDTFSLALKGEFAVTADVSFDLTLVDPDGVTSTRGYVLKADEDAGPKVELAVDVLRKQGNAYLCTPIALVPFVSESSVVDAVGLGNVEWEWSAAPVASPAAQNIQAQAAAAVWAFAPLTPSLGNFTGPAAGARVAAALGHGGKNITKRAPVSRWEELLAALSKNTLAGLKERLTQPVDPQKPALIRAVPLKDPVSDAFDLERYLPELKAKDADDAQPRYRVELAVLATDANVESGPRTGTNVDPVRLLVVSEQDLLAEVSKDEETLMARFDEMLARLKAAQAKFADAAARVGVSEPPADAVAAAAVRTADVLQDVGKGRDGAQGLAGEYRRLRREVEVNRCNRSVGERYESAVIRPLEAALAAEFPRAEDAVGAVQSPLAAGRAPGGAALADGREKLAALVARLTAIRDQLGEVVSLNKLREDLRQIIERQRAVSAALQSLREGFQQKLFTTRVRPADPVEVPRGEKVKVGHDVDWSLEDDELTAKLEYPADGAVTGPPSVTIKQDDTKRLEYELKAGTKPGEYVVRVVPGGGPALEVRVVVK